VDAPLSTEMQVTGRSLGRIWQPVVALALAAACSTADGEKSIAEYDRETGRLRRLTVDVNGNGRNDTVSHMDGTRIDRIELDLDENGRLDRWDFYRTDRTLESVGFSRFNDGVMDARAFYGAGGKVARIELSTGRDGRFNKVEFYEAGLLVRGEEDTNGDGRADKWETYAANPGAAPNEPPFSITSVAFDDSGRGVPQRRVIYDRGGRAVRTETHH
jgi:hypothetical protein